MLKYVPITRGTLIVGLLICCAFVSAIPTASGVTIGPPVQIGTVTSFSLTEISGIVDSRANTDAFWVHNDRGDNARFFAISHSGGLLGTFPLAGALSGDWEDIAIGPKPGGDNYLYLGDIGDNDSNRPFITVYRTDEPQSTTGTTIPAGSYSPAKLQYPGGSRNAESLFVDPLTSEIFIITKTTIPQIYSAPATAFDDPDQTTTMTALGTIVAPLFTATAADISPDGRFILVRSKTAGYLFERTIGQSVADALHGAGVPFTLGAETQGEAIGWAADGNSFYTTSEWDELTSAPIYSYAFTAPPALLAGDYNNDHLVDAADYTVWRNQLGANIALPNEADTPGVVTTEDYDVWLAHFGESSSGRGAAAPSPGAMADNVPEPSSCVLAALGMVVLAAWRSWQVAGNAHARQPISSGGVSWCLYITKYSR